MSKAAFPAPPGEQWPKETDRAFSAFRIYLEAGPTRSTAQVGQELGHRSAKQAQKWSTRWRWRDRVEAYERAAVHRRDDAHLDEIAKRSRRQAQLAQLYQEAGAVIPTEILRRHQEGELGAKLGDMSLPELLQLDATLARAHHRVVVTERLALGMTTEQEGEPLPRAQAEEHARRLTDDQLDARLAGVDELAARREAKATGKKKAAAAR